MAFLVPDKTEVIHGVTIKTKIIPLTAKMNKATGRHKKGDPFRDQRKLNAKGITAHNTPAINQAKGTTMSEQYSRATYPNQNMDTVRPHYYVDDVEAWYLVREDEVSWCQGEAGNISDISVEIIGSTAKAEDNGARLIAMIMNRHKFPISQLRTHNYWRGLPNKIVVGAAKNCPVYILPHWDTFVKKVEGYMREFGGGETPGKLPYTIKLKKGTPYYAEPDNKSRVLGEIKTTTNYTIVEEKGEYGWLKSGAGWVQLQADPAPPEFEPYTVKLKKGTPYYSEPDNKSMVVGKIETTTNYTIVEESGVYGMLKSGAGWVQLEEEPEEPEVFKPYVAKVTTNVLNIRQSPTTQAKIVGTLRKDSAYTIVEEQDGQGSVKGWGKLKSGAGWIALDFVQFIRYS